jgi:CheY-like chemotaxis protein
MGKRPLIMIVEDDIAVRRLWRTALRLNAFEVVEAGDGVDALRLLEQAPPDLVVLDLGLPRLGGVSVRQEIAAQTLTRHIPVVIVTASTEALSHLDVSCILRKPVAADELIEVVRKCLASGAPGARH